MLAWKLDMWLTPHHATQWGCQIGRILPLMWIWRPFHLSCSEGPHHWFLAVQEAIPILGSAQTVVGPANGLSLCEPCPSKWRHPASAVHLHRNVEYVEWQNAMLGELTWIVHELLASVKLRKSSHKTAIKHHRNIAKLTLARRWRPMSLTLCCWSSSSKLQQLCRWPFWKASVDRNLNLCAGKLDLSRP